MYIAIVRTENNRISKFKEYATNPEAQAHVTKYGGFVYDNAANTPLRDLWIVGTTVTVVPFVEYVPTLDERFGKIFSSADFTTILFEAIFELVNRTQILELKPQLTRTQVRDWLKSKLP